ncbi:MULTISPECIES: ABC transporter substrate-binding protein [unclassified Bradyrhizobium]|uniref:ABC transporter substrate-binding protein n=2 Tax=Nitrobacteraceae TaxID=41294 RepID=UPI00046632C2|nr:iron ABC transporter [Bradyrhizobium elkanii]OCX29259.1 iron ABC transporter [Bradyrhizobium sp. UASWS1016]
MRMRWLAVTAAAWLISASAVSAAGPRVVSMNVCSDQLVLSLADPDQILGLSRFARDAWQSWAADKARNYPLLSGGAEDVLLLRPDLVVVSLFDKRATRDLLKANGLHLVEFTVPRTLDEVKDQIRAMGDVLQHPDRAQAEVARLDAAIARVRAVASVHHYRVLPLERRGFVSGDSSLISSLLTATGLTNVAGELGLGAGGFASLEAIVKLRPDFILVSEAGDRAEDEGRAFLLHPALERFYPREKRIVLPERLTVCGGVMLADALDWLTAELQRVTR